MVFKCWHIKSGWIFWPVNVHVIFVFIFVFWCCWYEINEPQSTFATLLPEKSNCQFQEQFCLFACLCMSLYVLNMSFMESIMHFFFCWRITAWTITLLYQLLLYHLFGTVSVVLKEVHQPYCMNEQPCSCLTVAEVLVILSSAALIFQTKETIKMYLYLICNVCLLFLVIDSITFPFIAQKFDKLKQKGKKNRLNFRKNNKVL